MRCDAVEGGFPVFVFGLHQFKGVLFMPRCARIDEPPAGVADILQLHIHRFRALTLGTAYAVFQIHDVVRNDDVRVFTRNAAANADAL